MRKSNFSCFQKKSQKSICGDTASSVYHQPQHNALIIPVSRVIENEHVSLKPEERLRVPGTSKLQIYIIYPG